MTPEELKKKYSITVGSETAKKYLLEYKIKTEKKYYQYMAKKIEESAEFGPLVSTIMKQFGKLTHGGKRFRGALVVLGYMISGGKNHRAIRETSLFIEILQTGVLVHDDIMDRDSLRRGVPTIHTFIKDSKRIQSSHPSPEHYGISMGICAGDVALFMSQEKLLEGKFPDNRILKASLYFAKFMQRLGYGQALDVSNDLIDRNDEKRILQIMQLKSSEYTAVLPLKIGMILAGEEDKKRISAIEKYAMSLGWAFQIQDDVLGTFGNSTKTGKPSDSDIKEGKYTLLISHLDKNGSNKDRALLDKVLGNPKATKLQIDKLRKALLDNGSVEYMNELGWNYVKKAIKQVPKITSDPKLKEILESCVVMVMDRSS